MQFEQEVRRIGEHYRRALELHKQGEHLASVDEKTGIQALERSIKRAIPGFVERREFEYKRHGTLCLFAAFEVATGRIIEPWLNPTRTEADFASWIERLIDTDKDARWTFIVDQLNTHMSESLVRLVARRCEIDVPSPIELGLKGKRGILKSMKTRKRFLEDPSHRIRFVYTPKHCSWLNQVEIWFSILVRRLLKRASFASLDELEERILAFIEYFNATMAKPFKWTYMGKPLKA